MPGTPGHMIGIHVGSHGDVVIREIEIASQAAASAPEVEGASGKWEIWRRVVLVQRDQIRNIDSSGPEKDLLFGGSDDRPKVKGRKFRQQCRQARVVPRADRVKPLRDFVRRKDMEKRS